MRYCGRQFTDQEIDWIKHQVATVAKMNRRKLSIQFCDQFGWRKPDGGLKDMSCRVAFLKMEKDGLICLPKARAPFKGNKPKVQRTLLGEPQREIAVPAGKLELKLELTDKGALGLWNELIDRYHYLGYMPLAGAQLRYFVESQYGTVALMGFSAAARKTAPRDQYIGWAPAIRKKNLNLAANNSRFLILPWVRSKYLASRVLAMSARRLAQDWQSRYHYRPVLLETFVEERFKGVSYKAAGWTEVGKTQGRGKLDRHHKNSLPVKTVWVCPLEKNFRSQLLEDYQ